MSDQSVQESIDEIWKLFKETSAQFKETDARLSQQFKETDALLSRQFKETGEQIRQLEGLFGSQWGKMLEALVKPGALRLFQDWGVDVHRRYERSVSQINGRTMELDLLLENGDDVVVVEVKSTLKVADVQEFLVDLDQFLDFFPQHRDKSIYGAVAGLTIDEYADRYAYRQGLFVLSVTGDGLVRILNNDQFRPTDFGASRRHASSLD